MARYRSLQAWPVPNVRCLTVLSTEILTQLKSRYSTYYLRWWLVNQSLRSAGRGIFAAHPSLINLYCRLLGAKVGRNVRIDNTAILGEYDLLTFEDGCRVDKALVRGFCVEREGNFRLAHIVIGKNATINTYTQIAPGATIPEGTVFGPHASSHEQPSPESFVKYNRTKFRQPHILLRLFVGLPIIFVVVFISYIPWFAVLYGMVANVHILGRHGLNSVESVLSWFAYPSRVGFHILARVLRVVAAPILQVFFGIIVKRLMGLNKEGLIEEQTQMTLLRRYINSSLLSQYNLRHAFDVLGTHYEMTSVSHSLERSFTAVLTTHRLYSVLWVRKSASAYTGQAQVSIVRTQNCSKSGTTSYSGRARRSSPQTILDRRGSLSVMEP